ncbi:unnamed protein product [Trichogramma brassicae]|uniref:Uncharacterized protein n=1 Tax=Trichogramma brassicae TaxID=86971 RepID=A0A6H5IWY9_9HYME|nr:unnamed protein product [Trichogramma brassicae]
MFSAAMLNGVFMSTFHCNNVRKYVFNISSYWGLEPDVFVGSYCSAKAAKDMFFKALTTTELVHLLKADHLQQVLEEQDTQAPEIEDSESKSTDSQSDIQTQDYLIAGTAEALNMPIPAVMYMWYGFDTKAFPKQLIEVDKQDNTTMTVSAALLGEVINLSIMTRGEHGTVAKIMAHHLLCLIFVAALANADETSQVVSVPAAAPVDAHGRTAVGTFDWNPNTGTLNIQGHNDDFASDVLQAANDTDQTIDGTHDRIQPAPMQDGSHRYWWQDAPASPFHGESSDGSTSPVASTSTELQPPPAPSPVINAKNPFFRDTPVSAKTSALFSLITPGSAGQAGQGGGAGSGNAQGGGGGGIGSGAIANAILNGQGVAASQSIGNIGGGVGPTARPPVIVGTGQTICQGGGSPQAGGGVASSSGSGQGSGGSQSGIGSQIVTQGGGGGQGGNLGTGGGNQGIHWVASGGSQGIHLGGGGGGQGIQWGTGGGNQGIHLGGGGINQGGLGGSGGGNQGIHLGGGGGGQGGLVGSGGGIGQGGGLLGGGGGGNHPILAGYAGLAALGNHFVAGSGAAHFISAIHSAHRPFRPSAGGGGGVVPQAGGSAGAAAAAAAGAVSQAGSSNLQAAQTGTAQQSSTAVSGSGSASASAESSATASATGESTASAVAPALIAPTYLAHEEPETRYVETQSNVQENHENEVDDEDRTRRTSSCSRGEGKICVPANLCIDGLYVPLSSAAIDSSSSSNNNKEVRIGSIPPYTTCLFFEQDDATTNSLFCVQLVSRQRACLFMHRSRPTFGCSFIIQSTLNATESAPYVSASGSRAIIYICSRIYAVETDTFAAPLVITRIITAMDRTRTSVSHVLILSVRLFLMNPRAVHEKALQVYNSSPALIKDPRVMPCSVSARTTNTCRPATSICHSTSPTQTTPPAPLSHLLKTNTVSCTRFAKKVRTRAALHVLIDIIMYTHYARRSL